MRELPTSSLELLDVNQIAGMGSESLRQLASQHEPCGWHVDPPQFAVDQLLHPRDQVQVDLP
jgi:hypothetical protein